MEKYKLNLQLFANANTNVTTANTTGNDLSADMKVFYSKELIEMASANLVHNQFGDKKPIPAHGGKKIEWRKWSHYPKALTPLTEGVTPDGRHMNVGYIEKEIAQYGDYTTLSDMLELTAIDDVVMEATDQHGQQMGMTLDTITRNELQSGLNVIYAPIQGTPNVEVTSRKDLTNAATLSPDVVARAATFLKKQNAPKIDGKYVAIIHPSVAYDLRKDADWIDVRKYAAPQPLFNGEIGELHGVRFVETTEAKIYAAPEIVAGKHWLTLKTALDGTGSTTIAVKEAISATEAAA